MGLEKLLNLLKGSASQPKNLDPKIKSLVEAVNACYRTSASCEGHIDWGNPYPWVELATGQNLGNLQEQINNYNSQNEIKWGLHKSHFDPNKKQSVYRLMPLCKIYADLSEYRKEKMDKAELAQLEQNSRQGFPLESLQDSTNNLAIYLSKVWRKSKIFANGIAA